MKYIYHHLGLGDHIICNGLVRHFCELHDEVTVFCKTHNYENVSYMFRDEPKIKILPLNNDNEVELYIRNNNLYQNIIKVGFDRLWSSGPKTFDIGFYNSINIPFDYRFTKFKFERDYESEKKIIEELNPNNEEYVFVHDDIDRGFSIDKNKIRTDLKIIKNDTKYNFFHMLGVIENTPTFTILRVIINLQKLIKMIGENIEDIIRETTKELLNRGKNVEMPEDLIQTDNIGEVIEKLSILHCRMWYLEDAISSASSDGEIAELKRKIDICFKVKRPRYVEAINRMMEDSIVNSKSLVEDSVKHYKGFSNE
jgi:hypothetical protein